jgi:hypothetical protein
MTERGADNSSKRNGVDRMDGTGRSPASKYDSVSPEREHSNVAANKQATLAHEKSILNALRTMPVIQKRAQFSTAISANTC